MKHFLVFLAVLPALVPGQSITVNLGTTYQKIDGFGFSEAFGFVSGIYGLPAAQQKVAFDYLFSKTTGAALNIVRNRIGSDSGTTIEPNNPGGPSATPKYVALPNNDENQLWFSLIAKNNYSVPTFYADAWSAPGYMKTTGNEANGGYLCGVTGQTCSSGDWRTAYANYLVQYLKDYQAAGINVNYVGFLNEPEFDASYSSMLSDGTQAASFISVFAPILKASGLSTGITCCDAEGWNMQKTFTAQLTSAGAIPNLALITSHSYTSSPTSPISTTLRVWQTEYADLDGDNMVAWYSNGDASEGLTWANHIYTALVNANISAYLHWIGIQSGVPNAALVGINNNQPVPTGRLWAFGLWSRYVQPGAVRIGASGSTGSSLVSAFKNLDGSVSVQVINNGDSAQTVSINFSGLTPTTVQAFYTSNTNNNIGSTTASISGGAVSGSSPARSMVVFVVNGTGGGTTTSAHSSTTTTSTTTTHSSTTTPVTGCSAEWGQCGGIGWTGATCCASGTTCQSSNPYYSQCLAS